MLRGALHDPAVSNQLRLRPINVYEMRYSMRGAYQEATDTSSACGAARQKPGRVIVRHFCDRIVLCNMYKPRSTLTELRMILLSQISSDQCPIDKYEMHTARGELIRKLRTRHLLAALHGTAQLGRSQTASSRGTFATGLCAAMSTSQVCSISRPRNAVTPGGSVKV
ncbi:MAG: hypothetical protein M1813_001556 [Trichoglossum hirsutum]|nr:MAG: hypothetical protein M1813_001556 [Trichoglossum hirsutum]